MADVTRVSTFTLAGEASTRRSAALDAGRKGLRAKGLGRAVQSEFEVSALRTSAARPLPASWHSRIIHQPLVALIPGVRLGSYEILSPLGAGGMGEVYKRDDTKLRDVAIKVLPDAVRLDPERFARFQREARSLASLNHPNIGGIHGLEASGRVTALVMELVEGRTLADRIAQGPIPLDEALPIAKQIAEALEAAHEQRDHPSRPETREHQGPRGRHCEGAGLRSR